LAAGVIRKRERLVRKRLFVAVVVVFRPEWVKFQVGIEESLFLKFIPVIKKAVNFLTAFFIVAKQN
jgi:hypothetical protein